MLTSASGWQCPVFGVSQSFGFCYCVWDVPKSLHHDEEEAVWVGLHKKKGHHCPVVPK